jgi:hypothetical protein
MHIDVQTCKEMTILLGYQNNAISWSRMRVKTTVMTTHGGHHYKFEDECTEHPEVAGVQERIYDLKGEPAGPTRRISYGDRIGDKNGGRKRSYYVALEGEWRNERR